MDGFELSVVIDRPVEEVFAVLADLENDAQWRREWDESKKISDGPIGIGTRFSLSGKAFGRRFAAEYETTRFEQDHVSAWKTVSGPLPLTFHRTVDRVEDGGTKVTIGYEAEPRGFLKLMGPLVKSLGKRALRGDFPKLKELMESHAL